MTPPADGSHLRPHTHAAGAGEGLQARVHDPLWMLARQWQLGELHGDDAGTPAVAELSVEHAPITAYRPGAGGAAVQPYAAAQLPLEALVERERLTGDGRYDLLVEAGLHFLRMLRAGGASQATVDAYRTHYALARGPAPAAAADELAGRLHALAAGRVPDAARLHADLAPLGAAGGEALPLPAQPPVAATDRDAAAGAVRAWLRWYARQGPGAPAPADSAWLPDRFEYAFAAAAEFAARDGAAGQRVTLAAPEYADGRLDWDAFVVDAPAALAVPAAGPAAAPPPPASYRFPPTPVTFRGMPASRFWEFEDARVNLANLEADEEDVARRVLVEFALVYGNDWFVVPVEMPVGALCRVRSLVVTDTFGDSTHIRHASAVDGPTAPWRMFGLSAAAPANGSPADTADLFLLPPVVGQSLHGAAVEEVYLLRDEAANMGWAVEHSVESEAGGRIDRVQASHARRGRDDAAAGPAPPAAGTGAPLVYRLGSAVPDHWVPLLPEQTPAGGAAAQLRLATMPPSAAGAPAARGALGRLLGLARGLAIPDEEVPREGVRLTRTYQYARWVDGSTHLWVSTRKQAGRGEGNSGLRFDTLDSR